MRVQGIGKYGPDLFPHRFYPAIDVHLAELVAEYGVWVYAICS